MDSGKFASALVGLLCLGAAGCDTVSDYRPVTKNGQEYIYNMPVIATGVVEDVLITEKNGTVHSVASGTSDLVGQGGVGMVAATAGGLGTVAGGALSGVLSGVAKVVSQVNGPVIELMVRSDKDGQVAPLRISADSLEILTLRRCVDVGDRIRVVRKGERGFDIYNANPELLRISDFQPSCDQMKANLSSSGSGNAPRPASG